MTEQQRTESEILKIAHYELLKKHGFVKDGESRLVGCLRYKDAEAVEEIELAGESIRKFSEQFPIKHSFTRLVDMEKEFRD
jgi:hypothetical protein